MLCGGSLIDQLVVNVYFPRCLAVLTGALVDGDEFNQLQAHLTGQLRNLQVGFQPADEFIGVYRFVTDGLRLLLQRGDCFSERLLFCLVFFQQVDTDFFGNLSQHLVLIDSTNQFVKLGKAARGLCQLFAVGVGFGSVLLLVTAEEFLSCTLFIGKDKTHFGANVRKNKLVQNLDLNIVACTSSLPEFGIRTAGEVLTVIGTRVCSLVSGVIPFDIHLVPAIGTVNQPR